MIVFSGNYNTKHRSVSGWNALLPRRVVKETPPASRTVASIVIGGGYAGVAAARQLAQLEPEREVLLLESEEIGEGPSGRNSGFFSPVPSSPLANASDTVDEAALREARLHRAAIAILRNLVQENEIDCLWDERAPRFDAAATALGLRNIEERHRNNRRWGVEGHFVERDDLPALIGTHYYQRAYVQDERILVQPAALIRGLADSLPPNVHLLERAHATGFAEGKNVAVETSRGTFTADRLLITSNAWVRAFGLLRDRLFSLYTYGGLTPELDDTELAKLGSLPQWGIIPAHSMGTTLRKFIGRRLLVRSGEGYEKEHTTEQARNLLTALFRRRFPNMSSHRFEHIWGGALGMTKNGALFFGQVRPKVYVAAGCNGSGIARNTINGHLLAEMACGSQSPLLTDRLTLAGPSWMPPEPVRSIGAQASIAYLQRQASKEI